MLRITRLDLLEEFFPWQSRDEKLELGTLFLKQRAFSSLSHMKNSKVNLKLALRRRMII
jgi:hypothetical protein